MFHLKIIQKMISDNFDESEIETFQIESARDAVLYNFIVQRSLMPLGLSACESSLMLRPFFTEEQYRNTCDPSRRILYTLHLDLPRDMERSLRIAEPHEADRHMRHRPVFHLAQISVSELVHNHDLAPGIVNVIKLANDKTEKLRRYLNAMKLLKLDQHRSTSNFIFSSIIHVLYPDCQDSNLVVEFAETFSFYSWIFYEESPDIVGYVLEHAQRIRYNIWASPERRLDPINACIVFGTTENIGKLLQYGTGVPSEYDAYVNVLSAILGPRIFTLRTLRERRICLLIQLLCVFMNNRSSWAELQSIWRSIPDPYLSAKEFYFAFGGYLSLRFVNAIISYYNSRIVEEKVHGENVDGENVDGENVPIENGVPRPLLHLSRVAVRNHLSRNFQLGENVPVENVVPRPLCHLSRVAVRNYLSRNFQLPHGISQLGVPSLLENYLNLQC